MDRAACEEIKRQAGMIERDCDKATARNSLAASHWNAINAVLGVTAAILAAIAAAIVAGSDWQFQILGMPLHQNFAVGFLAVASAVTTSILTFLKPAEKATVFHQMAVSYRALRERCRVFRGLDCLAVDNVEGLRIKLDEIIAKRDELNLACPIVSNRTFRRAKRLVDDKPQYRNHDVHTLPA